MSDNPVLQSSLGVVAPNSNKRERSWTMGYLAFGTVLKVHHKRNTADVQLYASSDMIMSSSNKEGRYACKIGVNNAGYDEKYKKPYGEIIPIQKGALVLVGFLKNTREKPVILRVFHEINEDVGEINYKNILPFVYPITDEIEMYRYLNISRIQDFKTIDGIGNFQIGSHTKSFVVGINKKEIDEELFDYEDLEISNPDGTTIGVEEKYSKPMKYLAVFRDKFQESLTNWLRIVIDASKTSFKLAKVQQLDNKLSILEVGENGDIIVRRQLDTRSFSGSNSFSEVQVHSNGDITVIVQDKGQTTIDITTSGVTLKTTGAVEVDAEKDIDITGDNINMTGNSSINLKSPIINLN